MLYEYRNDGFLENVTYGLVYSNFFPFLAFKMI